jgi:O-antigen/teichoic acid export membrane protein
LIALFHDAETLAPYALSWKLVICLHLPAVAVAAVVAPRLIQDRERAPELLKRWMRRMAVAYAGVWAVVAALAPEIFGMIGGQYRSDAPVLRALTGYALLLSLGPLVSMACNFLGGARARLPVAAAAVAVNIVLDLALIPTWGPYGAALSSTLAYLIYVLAHARIAAGLLGIEPWSGGIRRAVRIAAGITTAVCVARLAVDALSFPLPLGTGIAGCAALFAYLAVVGSGAWR